LKRVYPDGQYRAEAIDYMRSLESGWREWTCTTKGGEEVPIDWANIRLSDDTRIGIGVDLRERKRAEAAIRASLAEKEVLLKEIHHRVKNNLQVIASLVNLQTGAIDDPAMREVLADVRDRVQSMALVHEALYRFDNLAEVEFADYAGTLLRNLLKAHARRGVQVDLEAEPLALSVDTAVPCGLILNELVVNALKHAFVGRDAGRVRVSMAQDEAGVVSLAVSDDGIGLPEGYDWRASGSLGLRLVLLLVEQIGGSIDLEVGPSGGSTFSVQFSR
jgi:two-component sensor histidine kinase